MPSHAWSSSQVVLGSYSSIGQAVVLLGESFYNFNYGSSIITSKNRQVLSYENIETGVFREIIVQK